MYPKSFFLILSLLVFVSFSLIQCGGHKTEVAGLDVKEDFDKTLEIYRGMETDEEKIQLWLEFLDRHPGEEGTAGVVEYLTHMQYLSDEKDPAAAIAFVKEHMAMAKDEKAKADFDDVFFELMGEIGIEDGAKADDWTMVLAFGEERLNALTPEKVRAEAEDEELTDEQVAERIRDRKGEALYRIGKANVQLGEVEKGLAAYKDASAFVPLSAAGFSYSDFYKAWARTLLDTGDHKAAMNTIAADAVTAGDEDALAIFKEAYLADGGSESRFDGYVEKLRLEVAKPVPSFAAYDYDGKKLEYGNLKGKVTLLAFWFPT
jgi:tetratricopeptide (TPR) repeat protein